MSRFIALFMVIIQLLAFAGCRPSDSPSRSSSEYTTTTKTELPNGSGDSVAVSPFAVAVPPAKPLSKDDNQHAIRFVEEATSLGIDHEYRNGAAGQVMIVETIGGGAGWLDFDNDGHWDLVANQGGLPTSQAWSSQPIDQLYQSIDGKSFHSVTQAARFMDPYYSQAVAIGDFDNDGFDDVYISNVTANTLWHNLGDGTFIGVAKTAGVDDARWSVSAAWGDLDLDGDLDLYVCNYCVYDPLAPKVCKDPQGRPAMCSPGTLESWPDACFFNQGDGKFLEQSVQRGMTGKNDRSLGVVIADFTGDNLPDIYVANDTTENFLYVNLGEARFEDRAPVFGCAVDREGGLQASMGVAAGDFDYNGFLDLYVTNYYEESNTLYANYGTQGFQDVTAIQRLHRPTLAFLGFGTVMDDFDHNGDMELMVVNGHVNNAPSNPVQAMTPQMFTRNGNVWREITSEVGPAFKLPRFGRGIATADYDGDGDLDMAVLNQNDKLWMLRNDSTCQPCINLMLHGKQANRRGVGTIAILRCGEETRVRQICGGTSYASSMQPLLRFPLGQIDRSQSITIELRWPGGRVQHLTNPIAGQTIEVWEP